MGRAVHLHPLAVALSIATGVIVAGIAGALLAVPIAACLNVSVKYLSGHDRTTNDDADEVGVDRSDGPRPALHPTD
jgi:predicted PurR-regulated permease PerM